MWGSQSALSQHHLGPLSSPAWTSSGRRDFSEDTDGLGLVSRLHLPGPASCVPAACTTPARQPSWGVVVGHRRGAWDLPSRSTPLWQGPHKAAPPHAFPSPDSGPVLPRYFPGLGPTALCPPRLSSCRRQVWGGVGSPASLTSGAPSSHSDPLPLSTSCWLFLSEPGLPTTFLLPLGPAPSRNRTWNPSC